MLLCTQGKTGRGDAKQRNDWPQGARLLAISSDICECDESLRWGEQGLLIDVVPFLFSVISFLCPLMMLMTTHSQTNEGPKIRSGCEPVIRCPHTLLGFC